MKMAIFSILFFFIFTINVFDLVQSTTLNTTQLDVISFSPSSSSSSSSHLSGEKILSRRKRFMIFPVGSSFSLAVCSTVGIYGNPQYSMISWGLNWGFAYELPTNATFFKEKDEKEKRSMHETEPMMKRRYRQDLFNKLELIMNAMGYDGRECILRSLCETPEFFGKRGKHLIAELVRTVFTYPKSKVLHFEHPTQEIYDRAYRRGRSIAGEEEPTECHTLYPKCGFSLIKLALGKYSKPFLKSFM